MGKGFKKKDMDEAKNIAKLFLEISETSKMMAIAYLTALRNKELADEDDGKTKKIS